MKVIWSASDTLCPKADQLPFWNQIPTRTDDVSLPGNHGTQTGRQDATFMPILLGMLDPLGSESVSNADCDNFSYI